MEELSKAARAYYEAGSEEQKRLVWQFFNSMDANGNGRVSLTEYLKCLEQLGLEYVKNRGMFAELDRNGDGTLDFYEVLTLYYLVKSRRPSCDACTVFLKALFFTCVTCREDGNGDTFDLCSDCYADRNFNHNHTFIIDNYMFLQLKRVKSAGLQVGRQASTSESLTVNEAFKALEIGTDIVNNVAGAVDSGCSIL